MSDPAEKIDPIHTFRRRSFVRRDGRATAAQRDAFTQLWPQYGLELTNGLLNAEAVFKRQAATYLEIGFGFGQSLLAAAQAYPDKNFIGVETHRPGMGSLLMSVEAAAVTNLRIYNADIIDVFNVAISDATLAGVQIFFPDPWQKRRHHPRRLIQPLFLQQISQKLLPNGTLHLATDWEDYAWHMSKTLEQESTLTNLADKSFALKRSCFRPIITKFEQRAIMEHRAIFELEYRKR